MPAINTLLIPPREFPFELADPPAGREAFFGAPTLWKFDFREFKWLPIPKNPHYVLQWAVKGQHFGRSYKRVVAETVARGPLPEPIMEDPRSSHQPPSAVDEKSRRA